MNRRLYSSKERKLAKKMILAGRTYREVKEKLNIPKSTLSTWFGKAIKKPVSRKAILKHLANIRKLATVVIKDKWQRVRDEEDKIIKAKIKKEIKSCPFDNIVFYKSLLAILYWAEGSKHEKVFGLKFANTDPKLSLLYISLLRKCYNVDESKFRIRLHVHYYHEIKKLKKFWSNLLDVSLKQFNKVYIKKRSKIKRFRKNSAGICFIYYSSSRIRKELLELGYSLQKIIANTRP